MKYCLTTNSDLWSFEDYIKGFYWLFFQNNWNYIYLGWRRQTFSCTCNPATWYEDRKDETCPHRRWATSPSGSYLRFNSGLFELSTLLWWTDTLWWLILRTLSELLKVLTTWKLRKLWGSFPKEFRRVPMCVISAHVQSTTALLLLPASPEFPPAVPPQRLAQVADRRLDGSFLRVGDWDSRLLLKPSLRPDIRSP